jgi:hypothetical protein
METPSWDTGAQGHVQGDTIGATGPIINVQVEVNGKPVMNFRCLCKAKEEAVGSPDPFKKPWDEVVREGSDYFPQGRMMVKVRVRFISDWHVRGWE